VIFNISTKMADNTQNINTVSTPGNINELLLTKNIIRNPTSDGINISEIVITPDGDCINKSIHVMLFLESMRQTLVNHQKAHYVCSVKNSQQFIQ
jgi:hypothetical protein